MEGAERKALGDYPQALGRLKATYDADPKGPLAEGAHYYWAECELRTGHFDKAKQLFLEGVDKFPKGDLADDGLHFAGEAAMLAGAIDEAKKIVARFEKEHPQSPLRLHEQILRARVLNAEASALLKDANRPDRPLNVAKAEQERRDAITLLEKVMAESHLPRTVALARFHLGRTLEDAGDFSKAVDVLAPLASQADQPKASSEAVDALALSGHALVAVGKFEPAVAPLSKYLTMRPKGSLAERALADRAVAHTRLGKLDDANADVTQLVGTFPHNPATAETLRRLAELSYDARDFKTSRDRFARLADLGEPKTEVRRMGLSGVGWSQYELNAFDQSAAAFGEVFDKFSPEILQVAEAGFMRGRALQKAGKLADAAHAYTQAFEKLAPAGAARPGEESHGPTQYGFFAGMQAANLLAQLKRYEDADAAYQRVAEHYPKADKLADVLFDWANVLYVAKKDAPQRQRIRDLLSRIEREFPASAAQPKARLFLAELDAQGGQAASADKMLRGLVSDNAADAKTREDALARLVTLASEKQQWKTVRELSQKYLTEFPKGPDVRVVRLQGASADLRLNDAPAAEKTLADLLRELKADGGQAAPWWPNVWILLAESQYQQRKYDEVEATVQDLHNSHARFAPHAAGGRSAGPQLQEPHAMGQGDRRISEGHRRLARRAERHGRQEPTDDRRNPLPAKGLPARQGRVFEGQHALRSAARMGGSGAVSGRSVRGRVAADARRGKDLYSAHRQLSPQRFRQGRPKAVGRASQTAGRLRIPDGQFHSLSPHSPRGTDCRRFTATATSPARQLAGDGARHATGRGRLRGGRLPDEVGTRARTLA